MAGDAVLHGYDPQMMATASRKAGERLAGIRASLDEAAGSSVLAPFAAGDRAAEVWAGLDRPRRRAVIAELMVVILHPAGRGARVFDPGTCEIGWVGQSA
jgi:hypothetical protein